MCSPVYQLRHCVTHDINFFFFMIKGKGTPKECPPPRTHDINVSTSQGMSSYLSTLTASITGDGGGVASIRHRRIYVESGLCKSLRLHQLAIPLECSAAARIPRGMSAMD